MSREDRILELELQVQLLQQQAADMQWVVDMVQTAAFGSFALIAVFAGWHAWLNLRQMQTSVERSVGGLRRQLEDKLNSEVLKFQRVLNTRIERLEDNLAYKCGDLKYDLLEVKCQVGITQPARGIIDRLEIASEKAVYLKHDIPELLSSLSREELGLHDVNRLREIAMRMDEPERTLVMDFASKSSESRM